MTQEISSFCNEVSKEMGQGSIRIIVKPSVDEITACALIVQALIDTERFFNISFSNELSQKLITELNHEHYDTTIIIGFKTIPNLTNRLIIFSNEAISKNLPNVQIMRPTNITSKELSLSTLAYFFSSSISKSTKKMIHLPVTGSLSYNQELLGINKDILNKAIENNMITKKETLFLKGQRTAPISQALQLTIKPHLKGISGSLIESQRITRNLSIDSKTPCHLLKVQELNNLLSFLLSRYPTITKDMLLKPSYFCKTIMQNTELFDLINRLEICLSMGLYQLALSSSLNLSYAQRKSLDISKKYTNEVLQGISWIEENQGNGQIEKHENFMIANLQDKILYQVLPGIAQTFISPKNPIKIVLILAKMPERKTYITIYSAPKQNLKPIISIIQKYNNNVKQKENTINTIIPSENEQQFTDLCREQLTKICLEETI